MSVCNLYSRIIDSIKMSKLDGSIISGIEKTMRGEMQHRAKLIALIVSLDRISKEQMEKGVKGK